MGKAPLACQCPARWTPAGPTHGKLQFHASLTTLGDRVVDQERGGGFC